MGTRRRTFGSVRKRASGLWQARYWHDGKLHSAGTFPTKAEASAKLSEVETDVRRGGWVDPRAGEITFERYSNAWLTGRTDLRPRSRHVYRSLLDRHLIPAFGHLSIGRLTPSHVRTWHAELVAKQPGVTPAAYRLLRAIFNTAVHDELLVRSPCRLPRAGTDRAVERPMLTIAEVQTLTAAMPDRLAVAVTLAAWGGLRRGEVLALRRRDVDPLRSAIRVERAQVELSDGTLLVGAPKTDAGVRTVHLPAHAMRSVADHLTRYVEADADAQLLTGRGGVPLRPKSLASAFDAARRSCGIPNARFHDLRHFALTMAATTGASTKELMRRAGHSSPAAALRYQHATEDRDKAIAEALEHLVTGEVVALDAARKDGGFGPDLAQETS